MNPYRGADVPEVSFSPLSLTKLKYIIGQVTQPAGPGGSVDTWLNMSYHILGVNFILGCLGLRIFLNSAVWWIWFIIPSPLFLLPVSVRLRFSYLFDCPLAVHGRPRDWIWDNFSALKPLKISMFSTVLAIQRMRFYIQTSRDLTVPSVVTWEVSFSDPRDVFISVKLGQAKSNSFVIWGR